MAEGCKELPEECWELIFNRIDHHSHFEYLSLVSKRFLSITNRLRLWLTIIDPTILVHGTISNLIQRFPNLKTLDLSKFHGHIDEIILEIAYSSVLDLEALDISNQKTISVKGLIELGLKMRNLKVLKCAKLGILRDGELVAIANSLPRLEELDISYPSIYGTSTRDSQSIAVTDHGIEFLSSNLPNLRKLNVSGNYFITDRSVVAISFNCLLLQEISVVDCSFVTQNGIHFMLVNSPDLSVISVKGIQVPPRSSPFLDSLAYGRALCALHIFDSVICDEFLYSIAKACLPLKRLSLSQCTDFTFSAMSFLLHTYQSLEYLNLTDAYFLTDKSVSDLSQYLQKLVAIKLNSCARLNNSTFFTLAKNCPLLKDIEMQETSLGKEESMMELVKNPCIKSVSLEGNAHLSDECLYKIASVCPSLELLDVCCCPSVTTRGITEILQMCSEIKHLRIKFCGGITSLGAGSELPKLEVLAAERSGFNDEGLVPVGKRCYGLLKLDLQGSMGVTTRGVEEVVRNCERLRELNLRWCQNVNADILDWMVFSRPSLKKLILPCHLLPTENHRKLLLHHGCLICED